MNILWNHAMARRLVAAAAVGFLAAPAAIASTRD